jgi:TatA/E family protein of Tat protein translocase
MFSSDLLFFDIGGGEIILIMLVALLLFGGEKLPELARGLGKGIRDFKVTKVKKQKRLRHLLKHLRLQTKKL